MGVADVMEYAKEFLEEVEYMEGSLHLCALPI